MTVHRQQLGEPTARQIPLCGHLDICAQISFSHSTNAHTISLTKTWINKENVLIKNADHDSTYSNKKIYTWTADTQHNTLIHTLSGTHPQQTQTETDIDVHTQKYTLKYNAIFSAYIFINNHDFDELKQLWIYFTAYFEHFM